MSALLSDLGVPTRAAGRRGPRWLGKGGRLHRSPTTLRGLAMAPGMSLMEKLRILAEPFIPAAPRQDETLSSFFTRRLGAGFTREMLPALVAGVFAAPPDQVGMDSVLRLQTLESKGGLFRGGVREGREETVFPAGGTGALAEALAGRLGNLRLACPALALEALPEGGWRVHGDGIHRDAAHVALALPAGCASRILDPLAPGAASVLAALPCLDLTVWHSRHPAVPGWGRGIGLLIHPPEGKGLLGVTSLPSNDPRGAAGLLQVRAYVGGGYPMDPALDTWPGVLRELHHWLPQLPEPVQVRVERTPKAFPLLGPRHREHANRILAELPAGLHWLGASRFGPGLNNLAEGVRTWARDPCA